MVIDINDESCFTFYSSHRLYIQTTILNLILYAYISIQSKMIGRVE